MQTIFYKSFFKDKTREDIRIWIDMHKEKLVGSAIFTKGTGITANLVVWAESWTDKCKGFKPSHTGSIVEKDGKVIIFNMIPPRGSTQSLETYLWTTKENFVIVLRDYEIDTNVFNKGTLEHVGQGYPYMSAIRSVFTKRPTQWNAHCSELFARVTVMSGHAFSEAFNLECTPNELLHELCKGGLPNE